MTTLNQRLSDLGACLRTPVLLFIRLAWGFQLAESGWGHLTHVEKTVHFFETLHIPFPLANVYISGSTELVGGVLVMLGLMTRIAAVPLLVNFIVAYVSAGRSEILEILHLQSPDDFINDAAFPFLVTALLLLAFGPGKVSVDALLEKKSASS